MGRPLLSIKMDLIKQTMIKKIYSALKENISNYKHLNFLKEQVWNEYKSPKVILGKIQSDLNNTKTGIKSINDVEFQVFSQFGDDGIIQWLVNKLPIRNKTFIEFGVENYRESNTRFLLVNKYWSGLVIDGNKNNVESIRKEQISTFYDLQSECSFITTDNINELIKSAKFDNEIGLLSIDIDGNDYWIWKAVETIKPIIVISEYNSLFGFQDPYTIPYQKSFVRGESTPFNFYGTSLLSVYDLAIEKGYKFIGCNNSGNNAYFVREDFLHYLPFESLLPEQGYIFSSFTEAWDDERKPIRGLDKVRTLQNQKVINTRTNQEELFDSEKVCDSLIRLNKLNRF